MYLSETDIAPVYWSDEYLNHMPYVAMRRKVAIQKEKWMEVYNGLPRFWKAAISAKVCIPPTDRLKLVYKWNSIFFHRDGLVFCSDFSGLWR